MLLIKSFLDDSYNVKDIVSYIFGLLLLLSFIFIYRMKKIGYYLYFGFSVVAQFYSIFMGNWSLVGLIMPAVIITLFIYYFKELE